MSGGFAALQRLVRETSGMALEDDKRYLVEDRLQPILRAQKLAGLDDLAKALQIGRSAELARLVAEALTINETSFFRDRALFDAFSGRMLPTLMASRKERRRLRIWCAGCSRGQEPYALAMLIDEQVRKLSGWQIEILATDLSRTALAAAERGLYSQFEVQRGLPVAMLLRHFHREGEHWRINDHLRAKVTFKPQNLVTSFRDLGRFDIIFCRNVLIYFDAPTKRQVLDDLSDALMTDGFLALGATESVGNFCSTLQPDAESRFVFVKNLQRPSSAAPVGSRDRRDDVRS